MAFDFRTDKTCVVKMFSIYSYDISIGNRNVFIAKLMNRVTKMKHEKLIKGSRTLVLRHDPTVLLKNRNIKESASGNKTQEAFNSFIKGRITETSHL